MKMLICRLPCDQTNRINPYNMVVKQPSSHISFIYGGTEYEKELDGDRIYS